MPSISVGFELRLPIKVDRRPKWYVACCPVLDLYSQGETEEESKENLKEAIAMFLGSCFERGTLDDALKDCGFTLHSGKQPRSVSRPGRGMQYMNVPLPMLVDRPSGHPCRA